MNLTSPLLLLLVLTNALAASAPENDSLKTPASTAFNIISERNIFNSLRTKHSARGNSDEQKPVSVSTITLVGTMTYDKGPYAFFDGSASEYRQVLQPGQTIAGYTIAEISADAVKLTAGTNSLEFRVGMQLRKEEEGPWKLDPGRFGQTTTNPSASPAASSSSDDNDSVIKRLMQQREQELK